VRAGTILEGNLAMMFFLILDVTDHTPQPNHLRPKGRNPPGHVRLRTSPSPPPGIFRSHENYLESEKISSDSNFAFRTLPASSLLDLRQRASHIANLSLVFV
jgi:hypothetical protein